MINHLLKAFRKNPVNPAPIEVPPMEPLRPSQLRRAMNALSREWQSERAFPNLIQEFEALCELKIAERCDHLTFIGGRLVPHFTSYRLLPLAIQRAPQEVSHV